MFINNAWYVAALGTEVGRHLFSVRMLNQDLLLYRQEDGTPVALHDSCPHRRLPLSMGRLIADTVECGYHGLTFDAQGQCVRAPACGAQIPGRAEVRAYPCIERYGLIWVWMGEAKLADPDTLIHIKEWDDPDWGVNRGDAMEVACNYLYITDNLLDPTHVSWVHQTSFGTDELIGVPLELAEDELGVTAYRWLYDIEVAPFYQQFVRFQGRCDRKQQYEMRYPAHAVIRALFTPAGTATDEPPFHPQVFLMDSYNFLTPIDEKNTRYFWFQLRNFSPQDEQVSQTFNKDVRAAFLEDKAVLEAVQKGMDAHGARLSLPSDAAALRFRKRTQERIRDEQTSQLA